MNEIDLKEKTEEIRKIAEKTFPAPWRVEKTEVMASDGTCLGTVNESWTYSAKLMANAREYVDHLLLVIGLLETEVEVSQTEKSEMAASLAAAIRDNNDLHGEIASIEARKAPVACPSELKAKYEQLETENANLKSQVDISTDLIVKLVNTLERVSRR